VDGEIVISPAELVKDILDRLCLPGIAPAGIIVGPATDEQQQAGVVQIMQAGLPVVELYVPVQHMRCQLRCLTGQLGQADTISFRVQSQLHQRKRTIGRMKSTDQRFLIHLCNITSGPSMHYDSSETWETLLFAELMIGTQPL
jgi:hypothetical protein